MGYVSKNNSTHEEVSLKVALKLVEYTKHKLSELGGDVHIADLGLDSLDIFEIVMDLEEDFDVNIEDCEIEKLRTVSDLTQCVYNKLNVYFRDPELA